MFVGYMDESYDGSAVPKVFSLSCLVSHVSMWIYFEWSYGTERLTTMSTR